MTLRATDQPGRTPATLPTFVDRAERSVWRQVAVAATAGAVIAAVIKMALHTFLGDVIVEAAGAAMVAGGAAGYLTWRNGFAWRQLYSVARDLEEAVRRDQQTGLLNHNAFVTAAETALPTKPVVSLLVIDIDRFKSVNDGFGHLAGDAVISAVAGRLSQVFGAETIVGRMGGEEFAVLLPLAERQAHALGEAFRILMESDEIVVGGDRLRVTVSIGVAQLTRAGGLAPSEAFNRVYGEADRALYIAKAAGRNRSAVASEVSAVFEPNEPDVAWAVADERLRAHG